MCLNWSKKSQKLLKQQVHDLWICLTCHVWTELHTTTSLLPTIYYNLLLFCCLRWWIRDNSLKNKHGFSFRTFFFVILQASVPVIALSKFVNSCYQMLCVPVSSHWWYWLKRVQVKLVAFNHRNFDWKFVCFCTGHTCCRHFSVSVVFSANWK